MNTVDFAAHGLSAAEYNHLRTRLAREPNTLELAVAGAMWSEHCSYKSSKRWLKQLPTEGPNVVVGPGENAGVVRLDGKTCVAFKIESHNHPSYIEPYHGAATGVGGILRDVFTMGARPVANLNSLRFGDPGHPRTGYLVDGVVRGIADYGNCMGVPTVAGETMFAPCYNGNILVNAMTVGIVREDRIFLGTAEGVGNPVFYVGSATGRDGIHGATMASAGFEGDVSQQRPAVQVGDPFTEKLLLEACLELMHAQLLVGIQDMGAAGLTSSSFEMAARAGSGIDLHLDRVPVREAGLGPLELMLSESQERMLMVVKRGCEAQVAEIVDKWDLSLAEIGTVADHEQVRLHWHGDTVGALPVGLLVDEIIEPAWTTAPDPVVLEQRQMPAPALSQPIETAFSALISHPTMASKAWITGQYDASVQGNTLRTGNADAAVVRVPEADRAIAVCVEGNARLTALDPRRGAMHIVAEGVRNLACTGAEPLGVTDCLNFGSPENPHTYWGFVEAVEGLADALRALGIPVVGGNVSLYNATGDQAIRPTPVIGFVGAVPHPTEQLPWPTLRAAGLEILQLGTPATSLAGSAYADNILGTLAGELHEPDWTLLQNLLTCLQTAIAAEIVETAHDVAEGGLLTTLAELCAGGIGLTGTSIEPDGPMLLGEDGQSILVAVTPQARPEMERIATRAGVPARLIAHSGGDRFRPIDELDWPLAKLRDRLQQPLPKLMGEHHAEEA